MGMHITSFRKMMANHLRYSSVPRAFKSIPIVSNPVYTVNPH